MNAALYIADPSLLSSRLFNRFDDVESYDGLNGDGEATGVRFRFAWGSITMNFMPQDELLEHLQGLESYAEAVIEDSDTLVYALARIAYVRMCLGCVIEASDLDEKLVATSLVRFNGAVNGLLFMHDSIIDYTGNVLGGPFEQD